MTLTQGWTGAVPVFCRTADMVTTDTKDEVQLPPEPGGGPRVFGDQRFLDQKEELRRHTL